MAARRLGGSILLLLGGLGCGDGGPSPASPDGGGAGMDAERADGGGGTDGGGGGTDAAEPPDGGTESCVHTGPPILDPAILPVCALCMGAHCVPSGLVPEEQRDRLADCDADNKCVPDLFIETNGMFLLPTCRSLNDAEGRCVSTCLPEVAGRAGSLPDDICGAGEKCVPCFDPTTGEDTGACGLSCDPGPAEPARPFDRCCGGLGACVPASLVPPEDAARLDAGDCTGEAVLCAPSTLTDPASRPGPCRSIGGGEGRCLPACLPSVAEQADRLPADVCDAGHLCAPCFDPTTGAATGACTIHGDEPAEPPFTFPDCCGGIGTCVPRALVPEGDAARLDASGCTGDALCAPDALVDPAARPMSCRSIAGAEGRCLPDCLPAVAAERDRLPRSTCPERHLCAPCYDPLTGADTDACRVHGDAPAEPPFRFERCCGGIGACVPTSSVPAEDAARLGRDSCAMSGVLCAPDELIDDAFRPPSCRSIGGGEGRCLPACLPSVAAEADRLPRDSCASTHLCAPCYDPISGEDSGACRVHGDAPAERPYVFAGCCQLGTVSRGRCVPPELVPADRRESLPPDTCARPGDLCVPNPFLDDPDHSFPGCTTAGLFGGSPGGCVPDCLVDPFQRLFLGRSTCATGELCAPCMEPFGGSTGVCD